MGFKRGDKAIYLNNNWHSLHKGEKARLKANLVMNFKDFQFLEFKNTLPPWWSDNLSKLFKDMELIGGGR